ncbi:MAG: formylglycine-generating enzyme family protein [Planctomycetes bacterium]|nr:formylglycine-generating enzyme family protein [Planctomycetota bacterium]
MSAEGGRAASLRGAPPCLIALVVAACAAPVEAPPPHASTSTAAEAPAPAPVPGGELAFGGERALALTAGQAIDLDLVVPVPGPVRVTAQADAGLDVALELAAGAGAGEVVRSLAPGRHPLRVRAVRGRGAVVVAAGAGPGSRASPQAARPGTVTGDLAPGGAHWLALRLPAAGAWTLDAGESAARVHVDAFVERRRVGGAGPEGGGRLTLDLEAGLVHVSVRDVGGQGGAFTLRARRTPGTAPDAPLVLEGGRAEVVAGPRGAWLRLDVDDAGARAIEAATARGEVRLEVRRGDLLLCADEGERAARVEGWLDPGPYLLRVVARDEAAVRVALADGRAAGRPLLHLRLRPVPPGRVTLGRSTLGPGGVDEPDPLADPTHEPSRTIDLPPGLHVSTHEVTQRTFEAVLGRNPSSTRGPDLPVHDVTRQDAEAFCLALTRLAARDPVWAGHTFRLPTEDEWEALARAGARAPIGVATGPDNRRPFAARLREVAWFQSHHPPGGGPGPFPVGGRAPNAWGLFDLHGNVAEWCLVGPTLPPPPPGHVPLRGGAWTTDYRGCRASNRDLVPASFASPATGFRVVAAPR